MAVSTVSWLLACALVPVPAARAQPELGATAAESTPGDPYGDVLKQAVAAYKAEQWDLAQELFQIVHAKAPTARTARGLGLVAFRQGRFAEAISMLEASLASTELPLTPELRDATLQVLQQAQEGARQAQARPAPETAQVGESPAPRAASLRPLPEVSEPPAPAGPTSTRAAAGEATGYPLRLAAGWTLLGTSLVTLGVGSYFGVSSLRTYGRAERGCPTRESCPEEALDRRGLAERRAWIANGTLGIGAVLGIVGGTILFMEHRMRRRAADRQRRSTELRPAWRGVVLEGRF